jgi:hypothetical protein
MNARYKNPTIEYNAKGYPTVGYLRPKTFNTKSIQGDNDKIKSKSKTKT